MHLAVRTIDFDYPLPEELIADRPSRTAPPPG